MTARALLDVLERNRRGEAVGVPSICSAHPLVLEACVTAPPDGPLLIEATCNQVNQEGGYTGMTPRDFRDGVLSLARSKGLPEGRLVLGGDHLGPNPWRREPAEAAMAKAEVLVAAYVEAGFEKIHLDASMACADDPAPLADERVAERAARLARAAERAAAARGTAPVYVVGTEVPAPGGAVGEENLAVTRPEDVARTVEAHREAFARAGLKAAWERVIAVVVQPGVEFGNASVHDFAPERARGLSARVAGLGGPVYEAHSTDYQTEAGLRALVAGHFAVLKVGPELTFALREAVFALAAVEAEWIAAGRRSGVREALERAMLEAPGHWEPYYPGTAAERRFARAFSLSDRCRYYWPVPAVRRAFEALVANLEASPPPLPLLSQHLPNQHAAVRAGRLANAPRALIGAKVGEVAARYARACGAL